MRSSTLKVETVSVPQAIFLAMQGDRQFATQYIQKLFPFMRIRIAALSLRRHAKQMRLHHSITPSQQLHPPSGTSLQHLPLVRADLPAASFRRFEKIQNIGLVEPGQLAQRSDGPAHLRTLHPAQESH